MREALAEAKKAFAKDEVPIGAVVVYEDRIIGRGHNLVETLQDPAAHAEMLAINAAANFLASWRLEDCILYTTLEPCMMCAGASYWTQISKLVFGAHDEKRGFSKLNQKILHPTTIIQGGIMENECRQLLQDFFKKKRN